MVSFRGWRRRPKKTLPPNTACRYLGFSFLGMPVNVDQRFSYSHLFWGRSFAGMSGQPPDVTCWAVACPPPFVLLSCFFEGGRRGCYVKHMGRLNLLVDACFIPLRLPVLESYPETSAATQVSPEAMLVPIPQTAPWVSWDVLFCPAVWATIATLGPGADIIACNHLVAACDRGFQWEAALFSLRQLRRGREIRGCGVGFPRAFGGLSETPPLDRIFCFFPC